MFSNFSARFKTLQCLLVALPLLFSFDRVCAAQDSALITLQVTNSKIEDVFLKIERQTGLTFYYTAPVLDGNQLISITLNRSTLQNAMKRILDGRNVSWVLKDKSIILKRKESTDVTRVVDSIPKVNITGIVTDKSGTAIQGATISLRGQGRGQGTDNYGKFSFSNIPENSILIVSSVGFEAKQVKLNGQSEIRISLDTLIREIDAVEVVSDGYMTLPRERVNGSYVQLDNKLINRSVSNSVLDRITNITSSMRAGTPATLDLTIRGYSTINASNYPLIVIDGFPYEEAVNTGILNNLNPNDVESVTILRDAASASIWGARSGNGVIVITTKKGYFNRKMSVQLNANLNFTEEPRLRQLKLISSTDAIAFERSQFSKGRYNIYDDSYPSTQFFPILSPAVEIMLAQRRGKLVQAEAEEKLAALGNHDIRDDISKYLLRTGVNQQYNLNVSGGLDKVTYYGSIGYDKNTSPTIGNSSDRITLRIDNSFKPFKFLELRTFIAYTQTQSKLNGIEYSNLIADGDKTAAPYTFLADQNGNPLHVPALGGYREAYIDTVSTPGLLDWHYRPLEEMKMNNNLSKQYSTRLGGTVRINILEGLNVEFKGQYETVNSNASNYYSEQKYLTRNLINSFISIAPNGQIKYPVPLGGILDYNTSQGRNWNTRTQFTYNKNWNNNSVSAIGGYETGESDFNGNSNRLYGYNPLNEQFVPNVDYITLFPRRPVGNLGANGTIPTATTKNGRLTRTVAYFGNAAYLLHYKYSITISGRIDASNYMGAKANQRSIPLWSTGLGWDISRESFFKIAAVPYLKLRATYGYNGNLNNKATALPTAKYSLPNTSTTAYHNEPFLALLTPPNPGLTWEKIRMINLGLDFRIKGDRLTGSIEYYAKRGLNLIGQLQIDATTGITSYTTNYASIKGKGIDMILKTIPVKGNIIWQNDISLSYNTDKVTDYSLNNSAQNSAQFVAGNPGLPIIGKPLFKLYSYPSAGLDPQNGTPRATLKGEATSFTNFLINAKPEDLAFHGPAVPQIFGNMLNTFTYKGLSLSFNITYQFKYYFRKKSVNYNALLQSWSTHGDYAQRWQNPGDETHTTIPAMFDTPDQRSDFFKLSSDLIDRGDHIRLQDLRLAYSIGRVAMSQVRITSATIFAYANNLGIIWSTNKWGLDPMYADNTLPPSRSIAIGLNVGF